jgi:hypothetical protein
MKISFVFGAALVLALGAVATPQVQAAGVPCASSTPMAQLNAPITNCPDPDPGPSGPAPVSMYSYLLSDPTTNSAGLGGICFDAARQNGILQSCGTSYAGVAGDGNIAVQFDWQAPGTNGCPSTTLADGDNPIAISVVASNGTSAFITVGASSSIAGYVVDMAFPFDGSSAALPIQCSAQSGVKYTSGASGGTICVNAPAPQIWSDCDPTSLAAAYAGAGIPGGACQSPGNKPVATRGKMYRKEAACRTTPDLRIAQGWTLLAAAPDTAGNACNPVPAAAPGNCAFVGTTTSLGGVESPTITGLIQIPGQGAAGDKVKISKATLDQGKLNVDYSTENEMTIVGFNVYAGGIKLNASLISAKGTGSNSYTFSVGRGAVKNNRTVKVEAVLSTGATVDSNTVTLK